MATATKAVTVQPDYLEFLAEEYLVEIDPKFSHGVFHTVTGDFGPFRPGVPVTVPLWLALRLRDDSLCIVRPPLWLTVAFLSEHLRTEKETTTFSEMPYYYLEISLLLLTSWAREDIPDAAKVTALVSDIEDCRRQKMQSGLTTVLNSASTSAPPRVIDVTNMAANEVQALRYTFFKALDRIVEAGEMQLARDSRHTSSSSSRYASASGGGGAAAGSAAGAASLSTSGTTRRRLFGARGGAAASSFLSSYSASGSGYTGGDASAGRPSRASGGHAVFGGYASGGFSPGASTVPLSSDLSAGTDDPRRISTSPSLARGAGGDHHEYDGDGAGGGGGGGDDSVSAVLFGGSGTGDAGVDAAARRSRLRARMRGRGGGGGGAAGGAAGGSAVAGDDDGAGGGAAAVVGGGGSEENPFDGADDGAADAGAAGAADADGDGLASGEGGDDGGGGGGGGGEGGEENLDADGLPKRRGEGPDGRVKLRRFR